MAIIHQKDSRSGITYVYEATYTWDKEKKQSRSKRKLIGRFNEETGEIVQTDGRCRRRSPSYDASENVTKAPKTLKEYKEAYSLLLKENESLKEEIKKLKESDNKNGI